MIYLKLTRTKAADLDKLLEFAITQGVGNTFSIMYFNKTQDNFYDKNYLYHLLAVAEKYNDKVKVLFNDQGIIAATYNTQYFINDGGFIKIFKEEQQEEEINNYTLRQLRQNVIFRFEWWLVIIISSLISFMVTRFGGSTNTESSIMPVSNRHNKKDSIENLFVQDSAVNLHSPYHKNK